MSGTGRKHSSKWDLSDEHKFSPGSKQMRSGRSSADVAGSNSSEWAYLEGNDKLRPVTGFSSKESYYGGRGSNEDDAMNKDRRVFNSRREWDTDGSYSRNMRHSQSPKNDWSRNSRSRSRSPPRGFRWDSGVDGRKRTRVGGSTRPCRDFAVGKCRRGSHCNFLHHDNQNRENSWEGRHREDGTPRYSATHESVDHSLKSGRSNEACINFAKGSCRMGASCKFVHDYDSEGYGKVSMDEFTREREDEALRYPATHESRDHSLKSGRSNEFIREREDGARRYPATHESRDHSLKSGRSNEFTRERENGGPRYPATYESRDHSPKSGRSNEFTSEREDGAPRYPTTHESRDYSLKSGRSNEFTSEREDGAPRYPTTHESRDYSLKSGRSNDEYGKVFMDEFTREREVGRRHRDNSFEQGGRHVPNRTIDAPCKFFASGNCRNGKHCRFSHDTQACRSPVRRLRDDRWTRNPSRDHQMLDRRKLSDSISPNKRLRDDRWGSDSDMADPDRVKDSPKRNDTVSGSDTAKLIENKSGNVGATEPEFTDLPITDGWGHGLDKSELHAKPPILSDKNEADLWIAENTGANMHGSQSIGTTDIWPGDAEMSPDWNYRMGSSSHMEEHKLKEHDVSQGGTYLAISEHNRIQLAPGQNINQNTENVNPLHTSSCHAVGQSQVDVPILSSREGIVDAIHSQEVSTEQKYTGEPNVMDSGLSQVSSINPPVQNVVSNEQLAQLTNISAFTNLSASLAHILGAGQQLPQLYAALNSHELKDSPSQAKTQVPAMPVSITCIKPDPAVELPKQYDPMNDSIEQKNADASGVPPAIPPSKTIAEVEILSLLSNPGRENFGNSIKGASSEHVKSDNLIHLQPGQNTVVDKDNNEEVSKERKSSQDGHKSTKENGPQNMDQNAGPDDAKQTKEMKGSRAFKFALAEFVKELLKPTWKEGKITKEDYKTIVKKVVDKVTGTIQEANIPQTQEKIDQYLSFSKPKLNKLVQAYVEKVQKG